MSVTTNFADRAGEEIGVEEESRILYSADSLELIETIKDNIGEALTKVATKKALGAGRGLVERGDVLAALEEVTGLKPDE